MEVQEIKDVMSLVIGVGELVDSLADGVSVGDLFGVIGVLRQVKPAIDAVKSGKLLDEYAAIGQVEKDELVKWFDEEFDIKEDAIEAVIEKGWVALLALNDFVKLLKPKPLVDV